MARNTKKRAVHSLIIYNDLTAVTLLGHGFFCFPYTADKRESTRMKRN